MRLGNLEEIFECDPEEISIDPLRILDPDSVETPELEPVRK